MNKLEHYKLWAKQHFPNMSQSGVELPNGEFCFNSYRLQGMFKAFQHAFTVRPTTDTRLNSEEFMKDNPETIVDRLRGVFPTANPPYKMTPLHYAAAREIERLRAELARLQGGELVKAAEEVAKRLELWAGRKDTYPKWPREMQLEAANILRAALPNAPVPVERKAPTQDEILSLELAISRHLNGQ